MYRDELRYVLSTLGRLGAPAGEAEDLCHEVFMAAFRKRRDFDSARPIRPWLFGFAYRLMLNVKRKGSTAGSDEALTRLSDPAQGPEELAQRRQTGTLLSKAIGGLDPDRRAVFLLHDLDGQPAPVISDALEIPLNTVYSRLRLARADLARVIGSMPS